MFPHLLTAATSPHGWTNENSVKTVKQNCRNIHEPAPPEGGEEAKDDPDQDSEDAVEEGHLDIALQGQQLHTIPEKISHSFAMTACHMILRTTGILKLKK